MGLLPPTEIQTANKERTSLSQGGRFRLNLTLPDTYPFKPPVLSFATKIYHPNVSNDDKGSMCLGILRSDAWKPSCKIVAVLEMARGLLLEPNPYVPCYAAVQLGSGDYGGHGIWANT
jgi:ubiquitin-protein ligase